ncbi:unnamed protein product [Pneumocystis jirovecii]|uniref:Heat shock protein hsp88 n=2 Tax=Pneumocystis jirovecii TaxID=42068 RepID=L0PBI1_PNEJI|nr:uncharacterized protein T551_02786 [Pneumocystis jirovecii RU7]KTW27819.1 hypothetical protein T551_02786 [Pneumocystis jirovecii RU7]CCJ29429.1 unnamed protein product [Pneumocystis jirovecii]
MSVVGIDFGSFKTVIAHAYGGNVHVVVNEVSNRSTPSMVSFGLKSRYLGESAKTQEIGNFNHTVSCIKRIVGRSYMDPEICSIEKNYIPATLVDVNGHVGVNFLGKNEQFTSVQLAAMYLTKIKQTFQKENPGIPDVVISVPRWFTDVQRRGIIDAAQIAGLNVLRIINDTTAAALSYGITKTDLPEDRPRNVCIVDIGHSDYTVSIVSFKKGQLVVKGAACNRNFGGRDFDRILTQHFAVEFLNKYNIDITKNPKTKYRVMLAVEKMKKVLSANALAPISVESLMNDVDVSCILSREDMEKIAADLLNSVTIPLKEALDNAGMTTADIDSVEMIGGSTRIPSLKERISAFFGKPLSFTLNQDEAVARGCAFACAILSPVFRVRDFSIHDLLSYPIQFSWEGSNEIPEEETTAVVFPKNSPVPCTKILTFYRKEPFIIEASYSDPSNLPRYVNPYIGKYYIKNVTSNANNSFSIVKVKVRINLHGLLSFEHAYIVEEHEIEEVAPKDETAAKNTKNEENPNNDQPADSMDVEQEKPETRKVKKLLKKADLPIVSENFCLNAATLKIFKEKEEAMILEDKIVASTENQKNALEEYIYEMRSKLNDVYADYASNDEKTKLEKMLDDAENWLYSEGEDTTKAVYMSKMEDLIKAAAPVVQRKFDADEVKRKERIAKEEKEAAEREERERAEREKAETEAGNDFKENNNPVFSQKDKQMQDNLHMPSIHDAEMADSV